MGYMLPMPISYIRQEYPGWGILMEKLDEPRLRSSDIKRILGLSYRQLNDWEKRGMLQMIFNRPAGNKTDSWRKFKILNLFSLGILKEIKKHGLSITMLQNSMDSLFTWTDLNADPIPHIVYGGAVFLKTDFHNVASFVCVEPDENKMKISIQDLVKDKLVFILPVNSIIDTIFSNLNLSDFKAMKERNGQYSFIVHNVPLALEPLPKSAW